jgi:hypothetical protein
MNIVYILVLLIILSVIAYIIYLYVYKPWSQSTKLLTLGPLNLKETFIHPFIANTVLSNNFTFTFYVRPDAINRTLSNNNMTVNINPILNWENTFIFGLTPTKSKKEFNTGTILSFNTVGTSGKDIVVCPALPYQKWTFVGISLDGRRIDVSYNGRIVASHILNDMPYLNRGGRLSSGSDKLAGEIGIVSYNHRRLTAEEIMIDYVSTSDTRGKPHFPESSPIPFIKNPFSCPAGIFCFAASAPPKLANVAWETPFA